MAAGPWKVFNRAKKFIGNGTLSLSSTTFRIGLAKSTSNLKTTASAKPLIYRGSITNYCTSTTGLPRAGDQLSAELWTGATSVLKFDCSDQIITALGTPISNIKYAFIFLSGASATVEKLLCYTTLTTSQITSLAVNNTLTIQMNSSGVLTLS
jgi:hypothetical protein